MAGITATIGGDASKGLSVLRDFQSKAETTAQKIADGFQQRIGHRMFDGLLRAAGALPGAMRAAIDAGGRLSDQMARTGAAGEGLVIFERALKNAGMSADRSMTLMAAMQRSIAGLNEENQSTAVAFAELGLSMDALRSSDPVAAMESIGTAINAIADPAQRTAIAMRLFGRAGAEALVLFSDRNAFGQAAQQLGSLPAVLSENAARLDAVSDRLANLGTGMQQIGASAAAAVLPALEKITARISAMDLSAVGAAVGKLLNGLAAMAPHLVAIGAAMVGLKVMALVTALASKTREWWAQTAAVKANTAALRENAAAGAAAAGGPRGAGRGAMLAGAGILAVAGIGAQLAMNHANKLAEHSAAMEQSFERGNAAAKKFEINAMRAQATTRAEIEQTIGAMEQEKRAIEEATNAQISRTEDSATRAKLITDLEVTVKTLDLKAKALRRTTDEQLAANSAARAAAAAEAAQAEAVEEAAKGYAKLRDAHRERLAGADEQVATTGALIDQLAELDRAEAAIRAKMSDGGSAGDSAAIARRLDGAADGPSKAKDMEQAVKLEAIEKRRADIAERIAEENEKIRQSKADTVAEFRDEMVILAAQIAGNDEKVRQLKEEAAIREEIARLVAAGHDPKHAKDAAQRLVTARQEADAAAQAAEARRSAADTMEDAEAAMSGGRNDRRAREIAEQFGVSGSDASAMAANEADLEELLRTRGKLDGLQFQSTLGAVSDIQRIGGGGGVVASGLDIARQQADLQRQMVTLLVSMRDRLPTPPLGDF